MLEFDEETVVSGLRETTGDFFQRHDLVLVLERPQIKQLFRVGEMFFIELSGIQCVNRPEVLQPQLLNLAMDGPSVLVARSRLMQ